MKIFNYRMVESVDAGEETKGVKVRWLISKETGAENFAMRLFEVEPGGYTPLHSHPWEHEIFILKGEGTIRGGEEERNFKEDDVIFIAIEEKHQIRNTGEKKLKFICLIPL
jgi:quercetin dioxygenase-like cupin family protein